MTGHNPNLDLVNINAHTKCGQILFIPSQDIEQKSVKGHNFNLNVRKMMCNN